MSEIESAAIDMRWIERMAQVAVIAKDRASEGLLDHDQRLGRTTRKNRFIAEHYENDIAEAEEMVRFLRDFFPNLKLWKSQP